MLIPPFSLFRLPRIEFGTGAINRLPQLVSTYGNSTLLVMGAQHFQSSPHFQRLKNALDRDGIRYECFPVKEEPSPELVDYAVRQYRTLQPDVVVGIGGGSALDAAKAIAGLLRSGNSVMDHLEGVGPEKPYLGPATPFIAVPTTAGTGSEATKNAVLSQHEQPAFKKSFRDEALMAEVALIDPDLLAGCPAKIIAANGMDAFTQLLESFVSSKANPIMDALAWSGMMAVRDSLLPWYQGEDSEQNRASMAYAALLSGITLAHVGLGSVHGLAAPLGAYFPIPHGVACGTLVAKATEINLLALQAAQNTFTLGKYARVGRLLAHDETTMPESQACAYLVDTLSIWADKMQLPNLSAFGMQHSDIPLVVANSRGSSMKTNPITLTDEQLTAILLARL